MKTETGLLASSKYFIETETNYYLSKVGGIQSIDDLMGRQAAAELCVGGLRPRSLPGAPPARVEQMLEGGVADPKSPANQPTDKAYVAFVTAFNFAEYGEAATTRTPAQLPSIDKFLRQTLGGERRQGERGRPPGPLFRARKPPASPISTRSSPTRRWPRSCAPRSACPILRLGRHRPPGEVLRGEARHRGFHRPGEARQIPRPRFTSAVGDQQPHDRARARRRSACCSASRSSSASRPTRCSPSSR